jgi:transposase-like protein
MKELSNEQKQFAYMYIEEQPMLEIARKLGVHRNTTSNWLRQNEVKNFITEIRSKDVVMTLQDKRAKLMEIINEESFDEVVNPKTGAIVKLKSRTQDRINALKLLLQLDGDLQDNKTINVNFNTNVLDAPKESLLIEDGNIIEINPDDFKFIDEEKGDEE